MAKRSGEVDLKKTWGDLTKRDDENAKLIAEEFKQKRATFEQLLAAVDKVADDESQMLARLASDVRRDRDAANREVDRLQAQRFTLKAELPTATPDRQKVIGEQLSRNTIDLEPKLERLIQLNERLAAVEEKQDQAARKAAVEQAKVYDEAIKQVPSDATAAGRLLQQKLADVKRLSESGDIGPVEAVPAVWRGGRGVSPND